MRNGRDADFEGVRGGGSEDFFVFGVAGVRTVSAVDDMLRDAEGSSREEESGAKLERSLEAEAAGTIAVGAAVGFWRDDDDDDFDKEADGAVVVRADSVDDMLRDAEVSSREEGTGGAKLERSSVESVRVTAAGFGV